MNLCTFPRAWIRQVIVIAVVVISVTTIAGTTTPMASAGDWRQFRGWLGDGVAKAPNHPLTWSEDTNVDWKVKVEGMAWSQPIVYGDQVLLTTAVTENQPAPRVGESGPGFSLFSTEGISRSLLGGGDPPDATYQWKLICLDFRTGERRWEKLVRESRPTIPIHRSNSFASETPVTDGKRIYVYVAMAGVYCFDMEGNEIWRKPLQAQPMQYGWGTGTSPFLFCTALYIQCDNEQGSYLVALNRLTGEERWRVERDEHSNWSTPFLWRNKKQRELITCGGTKTRSYNPATGELLWELNADGRCATTAVGDRQRLYVGSVTRSRGSSGTLTAVHAGASGDLSKVDKSEDATQRHEFIAWSVPRAAPELASPLLYDGLLYTLKQSGGIVSCFDSESGERLYRERLPGAAGFTASPWAAAGHIFCLDEVGNTFVIAAGPEMKVVATNKLKGMFWSSAAIAGGALLLRSAEHLYRIAPK